MRRASRMATGCGLLLAAVLGVHADDFWRRKPPSEWTVDEALQILKNSPWTKQESVAAPSVNCDPEDYDEYGNCRDTRFQFPRNPPRRREVPESNFNIAIYLVRWESAPEVAAAFARLEALGERASAVFQSPPPRRPADRYVITMNVAQPAKGSGDPFALREDNKGKKPVRLKTSRGTFAPLETERSGVGANEAVHFFFPRVQGGKPVLDAKGDTAEFVFEGARVTVKCKFSLDKETLQ
ncbi:MAG: hypothetical protein HY234_12845 [Acidobacteria bacterium]|nr:hypothetical protein [Acidobacteriota bacterium]MBI3663923.1 hypothetical protein [Acidobacteriota bacterium]